MLDDIFNANYYQNSQKLDSTYRISINACDGDVEITITIWENLDVTGEVGFTAQSSHYLRSENHKGSPFLAMAYGSTPENALREIVKQLDDYITRAENQGDEHSIRWYHQRGNL